jgi:hypothetical protein
LAIFRNFFSFSKKKKIWWMLLSPRYTTIVPATTQTPNGAGQEGDDPHRFHARQPPVGSPVNPPLSPPSPLLRLRSLRPLPFSPPRSLPLPSPSHSQVSFITAHYSIYTIPLYLCLTHSLKSYSLTLLVSLLFFL